MGVDLYICKVCEEPSTEYDGYCVCSCVNYCDSWICYDCLDEKNELREYTGEGVDNFNRCPDCEKNDNFKNQSSLKSQKLDELENLIRSIRMSKKNLDKAIEILNTLK